MAEYPCAPKLLLLLSLEDALEEIPLDGRYRGALKNAASSPSSSSTRFSLSPRCFSYFCKFLECSSSISRLSRLSSLALSSREVTSGAFTAFSNLPRETLPTSFAPPLLAIISSVMLTAANMSSPKLTNEEPCFNSMTFPPLLSCASTSSPTPPALFRACSRSRTALGSKYRLSWSPPLSPPPPPPLSFSPATNFCQKGL
mmetsp:Transcript_26100/g.49326  ORF Transcript_26100/g.49326 Transcript_26100/m.49326 type:complete len:200 (-) Transcript_26100:5864-6463(-)